MGADVPIAQWIERCPPEAEAQVRVLVGTLSRTYRKQSALVLAVLFLSPVALCLQRLNLAIPASKFPPNKLWQQMTLDQPAAMSLIENWRSHTAEYRRERG